MPKSAAKTKKAKTPAKPKAPKKKPYAFKFLGKVGRPPSFTSPEELLVQMDRYFVDCKGKGRGWKEKPTKAGLALFLGVVKNTLWEYETGKYGSEYSDAIKAAYGVIEKAWLGKLDEPYPTGGIFYLKNAYKEDYRDRYDHTSDGKELPAPQIIVYGDSDRLKHVMDKRSTKK